MRSDTKAPILTHTVADLSVAASLSAPVVSPGMSVVMYVLVRDEAELPISGAIPYVTAHLMDGDRIFKLPATDVSGMSKSALPINYYPGLTFYFDVEVRQSDSIGHTRTSVISWW